MSIPDYLVNIRHASKSYENLNAGFSHALADVNLDLIKNEVVAVVGISGSGKSTLLRLIAGLITPTKGEIVLRDSIVIGFVFQDHSIFPWMTVARNVSYALELAKIDTEKKNDITRSLLTKVGLDPDKYMAKYPKELSGGEKRRVAIASSLARAPILLLLDEPTSQLDDINKEVVQEILQEIFLSEKCTYLIVTHDIEEAIFLAGRVVVMGEGHIKDIISVDFPYPRMLDTRSLPEFLDLKKQIRKKLELP